VFLGFAVCGADEDGEGLWGVKVGERGCGGFRGGRVSGSGGYCRMLGIEVPLRRGTVVRRFWVR